ncbi:hypothetical protein GO986_01570 [Deinococcus sp. HMF7620]|uniref:Uncharacterized protein n=1 Tax=Deinococcus arboris TaxID=2682977 RepID=A0A7C9HPG1_9DEIO|nr:hypothetical protein [Deinococcus arboris]MVN85452.1 hypothetical protein [Deinococcus arboris]
MVGTALLALMGLRYPVKMIPLLLFELFWKSTWLLAVGLPRILAGSLDEGTITDLIACLMGVILVPLALPWRYVLHQYWKAPGDPWKAHGPVSSKT